MIEKIITFHAGIRGRFAAASATTQCLLWHAHGEHMRHRSGWLLVVCPLLAACEEVVEPVAPPEVKRAAVVGGKPVEVCQFPSTVTIGGCTATLIHPRVVTTAAH